MITILLEKLNTEQCSMKEVQEALVQVIEEHNKLVAKISALEQSGRILGTREAFNSRLYGL